MSRLRVVVASVLWLAVLLPARGTSVRAQASPAPTRIANTDLRVVIPPGWRAVRPPNSLDPQIVHVGVPAYEVSLSDFTPQSRATSCIDLLGFMRGIESLHMAVSRRPAFVPNVYFGSIGEVTGLQTLCLSHAGGMLGVAVKPPNGPPKHDVLTPLLRAIADAAFAQHRPVGPPDSLSLTALGVKVPVPTQRALGVIEGKDAFGAAQDVIIRVDPAGANELQIRPSLLPTPGRCEPTYDRQTMSGASLVRDRRYGDERWHPHAYEQFPPPSQALQAYACRNVGATAMLIARIDYELPVVTDADRIVIREILTAVGNGVEQRLAGR